MDDQHGEKQLYFRDYIQILGRRRWTIILVLVIAFGASIAYDALTTPKYSATAQLQLTPQVSATVQQASNPTALPVVVDVPTAIQVIESTSVQDAVTKQVPGAPAVSVKQVVTTDVVDVTVSSTDAKQAAQAAN